MRIGCRLLTLKIRLFTVFSVWKTTLVQVKHRISSKQSEIFRLQSGLFKTKALPTRGQLFSRKFDSIKVQTFKFENMKLKISAQSVILVETMVAMKKTIRGRFEQQATLRSQSRAKFKDIRALAACACYSNKIVFKISDLGSDWLLAVSSART